MLLRGPAAVQLAQLIAELSTGGAAELGIPATDGCYERLLAYGRSVAHYPTAVKEFSWRNGWFHAISQRELAAGRPDPFPYHSRLLLQCGLPA
ncbi:uncharacterized protein HaLaN_12298 [Haematococcus lacustris]|uniref:Uncharacterized protein n=1 Tax=Haematococcus lacustris TaxID=44745 RepID=A0A699ZJN7_HAELA|nr:uncharacterized protein HaLaN_12298 [Haematococcus lacustris]